LGYFELIQSDITHLDGLIHSHLSSLSDPVDSWLEDKLLKSALYKLVYGENSLGYAAVIEDTLQFFYVKKEYFRYAPAIFEKLIEELAIKQVFIMTQDPLLCTLISEWDFEKEKVACWFIDSGRTENPDIRVEHGVFRPAIGNDAQNIRQLTGEFFDGSSCLEERITTGKIFVLEDNENLLGCGIVENSQFSTGCVSIGMYVNRKYRKRGLARTILTHLKEWAYHNNLKPVAGCWYYNTLSRKSLESAGMIATSMGFNAVLKGKEKLLLRTGNPPGELVEEKGE